jgi:hypothetical protein
MDGGTDEQADSPARLPAYILKLARSMGREPLACPSLYHGFL